MASSSAKERQYVDRLCETCGKSFSVQLQSVLKGNGKFCSRGCNPNIKAADVARRKNSLGATATVVDRVCKACGKPFKVRVGALNRGGGDYCSRVCHPSYQALKKSDEHKEQRRRDYHLRKTYGISFHDYNALLEKQGGKCAICSRSFGNGRCGYLFVDHNHETGKVRGLLCGRCNSAIGMLAESNEQLHRAIAYLSK